MPISLQMHLIYSSIFLLIVSMLLSVKVVPNDTLNFGSERIEEIKINYHNSFIEECIPK